MNQYMMGECILVAPMLAGEKQRTVLLPHGKWYDFYSGAYAGEAETITITPGLEKIPMYVRDGGMVPMIPAQRQISRLGADIPLEIRHYGTVEGTTSVYDDDGSSFAYESGQCTWMQIRATRQADGTFRGTTDEATGTTPWSYGTILWKWMTPDLQKGRSGVTRQVPEGI
jgi:alpha-glucosidase (family GH31 glycosyl hydrolase)